MKLETNYPETKLSNQAKLAHKLEKEKINH